MTFPLGLSGVAVKPYYMDWHGLMILGFIFLAYVILALIIKYKTKTNTGVDKNGNINKNNILDSNYFGNCS